MNSDSPEGTGGIIITPSARKGIHSYRENQLEPEERMARYGLNESNKQNDRDNSSAQKDEGFDVVDNVMSKHFYQTSPLSIRKKKIQRTNSYSNNEDNTDNNYTNVFSKSLPATLPSHLHYSDDSDLDERNYSAASITKSRNEDEIHHSGMKNRSNRSSDYLQGSPYQRNLSVSARDKIQTQSHTTRNIVLLTLFIGLISTFFLKFPNLINNNTKDKSTQTVNHDKIIFENNMNNLQEKYNIDDNSILKLKTGISTIFSRMDTGSFMFVYNSKTNNFNAVRFEKFTDEVAYTAARYLRNDVSSIQHTVVESSNLDMQEHGELITRYRDDVDRSGVMLVKEIDEVPSELAMAFHYYCDEYDPLVKRSAIFFTLNMANCSNASDQKSMHDFIEKCLARKWKTVPPENMRPLLTRVVDIIIDVTSVF